ncbi:hypothetical protein BC829DRAFT_423638 [Chytridium lagenaria]|nr:hypothetical protein BC829DRAFT_423638 [Chytridium lagenaria]
MSHSINWRSSRGSVLQIVKGTSKIRLSRISNMDAGCDPAKEAVDEDLEKEVEPPAPDIVGTGGIGEGGRGGPTESKITLVSGEKAGKEGEKSCCCETRAAVDVWTDETAGVPGVETRGGCAGAEEARAAPGAGIVVKRGSKIEVVKAYTAVTAVYGLIFTGTKISGRVRPYPAVVVNPHTAATVVYRITFTGINMLQRSGRVRPYPASGPTQIAKHLGVYGPIWPLSTITYTAVYGPLVRICATIPSIHNRFLLVHSICYMCLIKPSVYVPIQTKVD